MFRLSALFLLLAPAGCMDSWCRNDIVLVVEAPGGRDKAVLFQRDCGATTGFSSQVSILQAEQELSGSGNLFIADRGDGAAKEAPWGGPFVELKWISPNELLVSYDTRARVFKSQASVRGIKVSYRALVVR